MQVLHSTQKDLAGRFRSGNDPWQLPRRKHWRENTMTTSVGHPTSLTGAVWTGRWDGFKKKLYPKRWGGKHSNKSDVWGEGAVVCTARWRTSQRGLEAACCLQCTTQRSRGGTRRNGGELNCEKKSDELCSEIVFAKKRWNPLRIMMWQKPINYLQLPNRFLSWFHVTSVVEHHLIKPLKMLVETLKSI